MKVKETDVLGVVDMLTCAPAEKFVPYVMAFPLAGADVRESAGARDQTCVPPTQTELMTVLPMRISVMLVPPTAMGIDYVRK